MAFSILDKGRGGLNEAGLLDLARLHRRRSEWAQAYGIWRSLAEHGNPMGTEALTKYLEHKERDYAKALEWVNRLPAAPDREHRRRRIEGKLRRLASSWA